MTPDFQARDDSREKKQQRLEEIKNERKEAGVGQQIFEKEMFNQLQAMTNAGVWTFDTQAMTFYVSAGIHRVYGLPQDQPVKYEDFLFNYVVPEDTWVVEKVRQGVMTSKQQVTCDFRIIRQNDRKIRWVHTSIFPILDDEGNIIAMTGVTMDTTDHKMKEFEKSLEELNSMGEMLNLLGHHWKQPLQIITLKAANLAVSHELKEEVDFSLLDALNDIQESARDLSNTIQDYRKIFITATEEKNRIFDFQQQIQKQFMDHQEIMDQEGIKYYILAPHDLDDFSTPHTRSIQRIFAELLDNAIEAIQRNAKRNKQREEKIIFRVEDYKLGKKIEILDTGGGIKDGDFWTVFKPFYSTKQDRNNTGLGLFISKMLTNLHLQGTLELSNNDIGGVTLTIYIPQLVELHS
tara:strand:- start:288 stop:1505 length:1218 start_codon:yes stop_codon:yes gene_type:complete